MVIFHSYVSLPEGIWRYPKIVGEPRNHPIYFRIVHYKRTILGYPGIPIYGNPHNMRIPYDIAT